MPKVINLNGPEGNAFNLLAIAHALCQMANPKMWPHIKKDMTSGNYEHLVSVFRKHFGSAVILKGGPN